MEAAESASSGARNAISSRAKKSQLKTPQLKPLELARQLRERVPELAGIAQCDTEIVLNCDSAHIGPAEWQLLARRVQAQQARYDGIVILHGTDTMAYTASALSFLLRPCRKPVILTGAQRPLSALRTDARRNLISAVEIAAHGPREQASGVSVFFDDHLFQGNRVRKRSASEFEAFESPQAPPLAVVGTDIRYADRRKARGGRGTGSRSSGASGSSPELLPEFSSGVLLAHVTPGFPARTLREQILPRVSGLVLVVFASGTAPTHDPEFMELLRDARKRRIPIVVTTEGASETGSGASPRSYEAGRKLLAEGAYWAGPMTPECAFVKAAWILGQPGGDRRFSALWRRDFAGEG